MKKITRLSLHPGRFRWNLFLSVLLFAGAFSAFGEEIKFPASEIPPELLKNADMVVRLDETALDISSLTSAVETVHLVYTVLRESAEEKAALWVYYSNDTKIISFSGTMYDASGRQTKRIRSADILDQSAVPSGTIYSDDRVKYFLPESSQYPYTVEYVFQRSFRQMMQYPTWCAVNDFSTSVEAASLTVRAIQGTAPRFLSLNFPQPGEWPIINSDSTLIWKLRLFQAIVDEPLSAGIREIAPVVYVEPVQVAIPGQAPEPASWKSYGMWVNWLNRDRGILPAEVAGRIGELTSGSPDVLSKMKTIYRYFQENTRYVSVQIGIGGHQPASALSVAKNGYGDCKALANYMKALLESAGISSYYTLVRAGKFARPIRTDFPGLQFNHAILCVPVEKDTVWLECTSQSIPFGFLGSFTDNRDVLLITPGGGVLAHTPSYPKAMNRLNRRVMIDLDTAGNARVVSVTIVKGLQYELFEKRLHQTNEEQKKSVREEVALPAVNIPKLRYLKGDGALPKITEFLEMAIPAFATLTGNRIFIPLNTFNKVHALPRPEDPRKLPFDPGIGFTDTDSILIRVPAGLMADNIPDTITITTSFGAYCTKTFWNSRELLYVRSFTSESGEFPSVEYPAYQAFIRQISKADRSMAVLKR